MNTAQATVIVPYIHPRLRTTQDCMVEPTSAILSGATAAQTMKHRVTVNAVANTPIRVGNFVFVFSTLMPGTRAGWMDCSPLAAFFRTVLSRPDGCLGCSPGLVLFSDAGGI